MGPLRDRAANSVWVVEQEKERMLYWQGPAQVLVRGGEGKV